MVTTELVTTSDASADLLGQIRRLADRAFTGEFSDDDWRHTLGGWHAVVRDDGAVVAHAATVERLLDVDGRPYRTGYVEAVATLPERQGEGLGSLAMFRVLEVLRGEFELGALSTSRHGFYERLGFQRWQGATYVRRGDQRVRTPEEDDGVMVLRLARSLDVDLAGTICCEARAGDDW